MRRIAQQMVIFIDNWLLLTTLIFFFSIYLLSIQTRLFWNTVWLDKPVTHKFHRFLYLQKIKGQRHLYFFYLISSLKLLSTPKPCHARPEICSQVFTMLYAWKSLKCTMSTNWISSTHCPCSFFKIKLHNQQGVQIHVPTISCL